MGGNNDIGGIIAFYMVGEDVFLVYENPFILTVKAVIVVDIGNVFWLISPDHKRIVLKCRTRVAGKSGDTEDAAMNTEVFTITQGR